MLFSGYCFLNGEEKEEEEEIRNRIWEVLKECLEDLTSKEIRIGPNGFE